MADLLWGVFLRDGRFMDKASSDKQTATDMAEAFYEPGEYELRPLYATRADGSPGDDPKALAAAACLPSTDKDAEIARLREALKPFAAVTTFAMFQHIRDEQRLFLETKAETVICDTIRGGDFRRARAALSEDTAR